MKNIVIVLITTVLSLGSVFSQAKKPTIMIVPSDNWCEQNGFMKDYPNQGVTTRLPDYRTALIKNFELGQAISKIEEIFNREYQFPLTTLESALKKLETDEAFTNGQGTSETYIDILNRTAKPDIIIELNWKINSKGPKKSVSFGLKGVDAYTSKPKAAASGTGNELVGSPLTVMLETAILGNIDIFVNDIMSHFEDMQTNGREGALVVKLSEMADYDLETEYELKGKTAELKRIINSFWMNRNTLNKRFTQDEASATIQKFSQVRIPLYGDDGWGEQVPLDFDAFGNQLADFLKKEFGVISSVQVRGLGQVDLILGGK